MSEKRQQILLKIILVFVLIQPFFDILSRLAIMDIIPNISTYVKPLFVFGITFYLLVRYNPFKRFWWLYVISFGIFIIIHLYIMHNLLLDTDVLAQEFRFMINIAYFIAIFMSLYVLYHYSVDKKNMMKKIKYILVTTFAIYFILYILAILTGTSGLTYEYSDKYKLGYKGWYDSGQILGHALSVTFPIILYVILKPNFNKILRVILLAFCIICVSLLGTKTPYFIILITLVVYILLLVFYRVIRKEKISNTFNVMIVLIAIGIMIGTYQFTPVAYNTAINDKVAAAELEAFDLNSVSGKKKNVDYEKLMKSNPAANLSYIKKYYNWTKVSKNYLTEQFYNGTVHPSNTRAKQLVYSKKMFEQADIQYKLFGIGFINQDSLFSLERDFFMALYNFGILGFILFLGLPIWLFIKSLIFTFKNLKKIDLEYCLLFMGVGIFFCISIYAGYTYIYTNFSIFLSLLMIMLLLKMDRLKDVNKDKIKNITFLTLQLGYGGIESATINSANALSKNYNVEIISFYKLDNTQFQNVDKNVKLKFLYDGGPNRKEFSDAIRSFKLFAAFKEGIKSVGILLRKHFLIIKAIRGVKEGMIVSTRVEFSTLLSKYGNDSVLKVVQEHCYHNNNKKYIKKISNCYYRIDYLCALTTTLKKDYEKFLKYNVHTKVVLLPNMITNIPEEKSKLTGKKFITVGRLDYGKRTDEIIVNFSKIKDKKSQLYVIGDGKEYDSLKKLTSELKLNKRVHLLGYLNHDEIEKYMLDSSCFLMASVTEGLPMVLIEAMSYGVPCIAYETASGTGDIIDNTNGYLIKNRNRKKYVNAMNEIISDSNKRKEFGENATKKSLEFSKDNVIKIWIKIISREI